MGADRIYSAHLSRGEGKRPTLSSPIWAHLSSGEGLTGGEGQPDLGSSKLRRGSRRGEGQDDTEFVGWVSSKAR